MSRELIKITGVDVRAGEKRILTDITWSLLEGEHWAVLGGNGTGKTTFLSLVRGDIWPSPDSKGQRIYYQDGYAQVSPVGFRERTGMASSELLDTYLRRGWNLSGLELVCTGFWGTAFLHQKPDRQHLLASEEIMERLGITHLKDESILTMSQGEAKKTLIARGLVHRPDVLVLDESCDGLDAASRKQVLQIVQHAAQEGTQILYATHKLDELVPAITHALILESGHIAEYGTKDEVLKGKAVQSITPIKKETLDLKADPRRSDSPPYLFQAMNANVFVDGDQVLHNIDWLVKTHENWAVLGPNGSGKTTLLRLVWGDLYPAVGGEVGRFGSAGPASIWKIKKRITYVSSRLQTDHRYHQTGWDTVLSGFFASVGLNEKASRQQKHRAKYWIDFFGLGELADQDIQTMSYGHQRRFLIARAMVTGPDLLLLDEPCGGLDDSSRSNLLVTLGELVEKGTGIVYATHHMEQLGPWITHVICLDKGMVTFRGQREDYIPTTRPCS